jgi:NTE family protein
VDIDGVFSGGGVKGFALIGAYEALEARGFRFKRLAGTSAGALIAAFIAAGFTSKEMIEIMDETDLTDLLDGRKTILPYSWMKWILLYWRMGLYKGETLEKWIADRLNQKGIRTFADLPHERLRIVASDLTNGTILILPDDLPKYGIDPLHFSVAKAVRMSVSIPYFFEPVMLKTKEGKQVVVDGGVLSNFPIFLFDDEGVKKRPVLGVKLSAKQEQKPKKNISNAIELYEALFQTMKEAHDARYISKRHAKNIVFIPIKNVLSTEFSLKEAEKKKMIAYGREKTEQFLKTWTY